MKVALYITVWRAAGRWSAIVAMSSMKPMSSMRSASSRTSISTWSSIGLAALQMVDQPARRRDQDVERPAQGLELRRIGNAADDRRDAHAGDVAAIGRGRLGDLQGELARRREDEDARSVDGALLAPLAGIGARREDAAERRQDERRGLAAAGRGGDHQVGPGERGRDGSATGRRWARRSRHRRQREREARAGRGIRRS